MRNLCQKKLRKSIELQNFSFLCTSFLKRRSTGFSFEGKFIKRLSAGKVGKFPVHNLHLSLIRYSFKTCCEPDLQLFQEVAMIHGFGFEKNIRQVCKLKFLINTFANPIFK